MAETNPALQEKLQELEHELEVSGRSSTHIAPATYAPKRSGYGFAV